MVELREAFREGWCSPLGCSRCSHARPTALLPPAVAMRSLGGGSRARRPDDALGEDDKGFGGAKGVPRVVWLGVLVRAGDADGREGALGGGSGVGARVDCCVVQRAEGGLQAGEVGLLLEGRDPVGDRCCRGEGPSAHDCDSGETTADPR